MESVLNITSKALAVAQAVIEISKNISNFNGYKKKKPRKLVSIYNKVKKNDSRSFHIVNFAMKQAMLWNQLMIIKSQPLSPPNFPKGCIVVGGYDSEAELSVPKRIAELMALKNK